jgi:dTMP kinase
VLLLYFDVDPSISMARVEGRTERDIYEYLPLQQRIRAAYEEILASFAGASMRIVRIDASLSIDGVSKAVDAAIAPIIERMHIR